MELEALVRRALGEATEQGASHVPNDDFSERDAGDEGAAVDLLAERVMLAVQGLLDAGFIELMTRGAAAADEAASDRLYQRVPPVPEVSASLIAARRGARGMRRGQSERLSDMVDPGILKRGDAEGRDRVALQAEFDAFFQAWCLSGIRVTPKTGSAVTGGMPSSASPCPRWRLPQRSERSSSSMVKSLSEWIFVMF